jgi:hypothetical protein
MGLPQWSRTQCKNNNIITIVAHPTPGRAKDSATQEEYLLAKFQYTIDDTYECPQGETLKTTGRWHKKTGRTEQSGYQFKKYRTPACKACPVKHLCTVELEGNRWE